MKSKLATIREQLFANPDIGLVVERLAERDESGIPLAHLIYIAPLVPRRDLASLAEFSNNLVQLSPDYKQDVTELEDSQLVILGQQGFKDRIGTKRTQYVYNLEVLAETYGSGVVAFDDVRGTVIARRIDLYPLPCYPLLDEVMNNGMNINEVKLDDLKKDCNPHVSRFATEPHSFNWSVHKNTMQGNMNYFRIEGKSRKLRRD
jgi:hypothetical protein